MKKIVYISTVGSDKKTKIPNVGPSLSGISGFAPKDLENIYLLSDSDEETTLKAVIKEYSYVKSITKFRIIDSFNYESLIEAVLKISEENSEKAVNFIVNVTGGTKIMSIGAFMGAILIGAEIHYTKEPTEHNSGELIQITMPKIPISELQPYQRAILYILKTDPEKNGGLHQSEIRDALKKLNINKKISSNEKNGNVSGQIVNYHCNILEEKGYIKRKDDEKKRKGFLYELTTIGSILANFIHL